MNLFQNYHCYIRRIKIYNITIDIFTVWMWLYQVLETYVSGEVLSYVPLCSCIQELAISPEGTLIAYNCKVRLTLKCTFIYQR